MKGNVELKTVPEIADARVFIRFYLFTQLLRHLPHCKIIIPILYLSLIANTGFMLVVAV